MASAQRSFTGWAHRLLLARASNKNKADLDILISPQAVRGSSSYSTVSTPQTSKKTEWEHTGIHDGFSGENLSNHPPMNVGQPALNAIVVKSQALVIETQQV